MIMPTIKLVIQRIRRQMPQHSRAVSELSPSELLTQTNVLIEALHLLEGLAEETMGGGLVRLVATGCSGARLRREAFNKPGGEKEVVPT